MRTKQIQRLERLIATAGPRFPSDCVRTLLAWRVAPELVVCYEARVNLSARSGGARVVGPLAELAHLAGRRVRAQLGRMLAK